MTETLYYLLPLIISFILLITVGYKWELKMSTVVLWAILMGFLATFIFFLLNTLTSSLPLWLKIAIPTTLIVLFSITAIIIAFFRDPERIPPATDRIIISPADGTVKYVKEVNRGYFPFAVKGKNTIPLNSFTGTDIFDNNAVQIGIGMSLLNVHINRAPISGKILFLKKIPGKFRTLKQIGSLLENERVAMVIENGELKIGLVLIASRLVRRILTFFNEGQEVQIGEKLGMICFGSQVDIIIPKKANMKFKIKKGDQVNAGVSVLGTF